MEFTLDMKTLAWGILIIVGWVAWSIRLEGLAKENAKRLEEFGSSLAKAKDYVNQEITACWKRLDGGGKTMTKLESDVSYLRRDLDELRELRKAGL